MTHKLLTFNEDYADEHNVPALACMTNEEYETWLESPSGELNENYEQELAEYNEKLAIYTQGVQLWTEKGMYNKNYTEYTPEEKEWGLKNPIQYVRHRSMPSKCESNISAWLGNGGDCFEESFRHLYLMKEFVETGVVKVFDVNQDFCDVFNKADLGNLSLCNVFEIKI